MKVRARLQQVTKSPYQAKPWWLWLWGVVALVDIALAFLPQLPFRWWVVLVVCTFGPMEAIGIFDNQAGKYPPLTDVIRSFVPAILAFPIMFALAAAAGGAWGAAWNRPWTVALWAALTGFLTIHFVQRYAQPASD